MREGFALSLLVGVVCVAVPTRAVATDRPTTFDFQYVLDPAPGDTTIPILDTTAQVFDLVLDPGSLRPPTDPITYLELEVTGLSHASPWDIALILVPPISGPRGLVPMNDQGDQVAIPDTNPVNLLFTDKALAPLPDADGVPIVSGEYLPVVGSFNQYYNDPVFGTQPWRLVVIDDDPGGEGSIQQVILRGVVPEPATLSLLALGALAVMHRRRG